MVEAMHSVSTGDCGHVPKVPPDGGNPGVRSRYFWVMWRPAESGDMIWP
jgi:hypothetical protein